MGAMEVSKADMHDPGRQGRAVIAWHPDAIRKITQGRI
jgi:hypothetical protein